MRIMQTHHFFSFDNWETSGVFSNSIVAKNNSKPEHLMSEKIVAAVSLLLLSERYSSIETISSDLTTDDKLKNIPSIKKTKILLI